MYFSFWNRTHRWKELNSSGKCKWTISTTETTFLEKTQCGKMDCCGNKTISKLHLLIFLEIYLLVKFGRIKSRKRITLITKGGIKNRTDTILLSFLRLSNGFKFFEFPKRNNLSSLLMYSGKCRINCSIYSPAPPTSPWKNWKREIPIFIYMYVHTRET